MFYRVEISISPGLPLLAAPSYLCRLSIAQSQVQVFKDFVKAAKHFTIQAVKASLDRERKGWWRQAAHHKERECGLHSSPPNVQKHFPLGNSEGTQAIPAACSKNFCILDDWHSSCF